MLCPATQRVAPCRLIPHGRTKRGEGPSPPVNGVAGMMRMPIALLFLAFLVLAGPARATMPAHESPQTDTDAEQFALSNLTFALYHEMGHLLIDRFSLPVLGNEEDGADNIATILLLANGSETGNGLLLQVRQGWLGLAQAPSLSKTGETELAAFLRPHSPDALRAGRIGCLLVGSHRDMFAHVALEMGLDEGGVARCAGRLGRMVQGWLRLRAAFMNRTSARSGAVPEPEAATGETIRIVYDQQDAFADIREMMIQDRLLEKAARGVLAGYELERPVTLHAMACGTPNAFYDPSKGEIQVCYELGAQLLDLFPQLHRSRSRQQRISPRRP